MKNLKNLVPALMFGFAFIFFTSCDKDKVLPSSEIPEEISNYISTHFPDNTIQQVTKEKDDFVVTYDVLLDGNISLEFNRKKEIIEIDGTTKLPDSVIPEKILQYVATHYPDNFITDWELEDKHQQVGLDNDLDLEFSMEGEFIRIDD